MENPIQSEKRQRMKVPDFHSQLALLGGYDTGTPLDVLICRSLFDRDAPRDYFTVTAASPNTSGPMYLARERTDSEKAVKGSKEATVKELAGQSPNYSNDEPYRRETEAKGITHGSDRAFGDYFGGHFGKENLDDFELWSFAALNRKEAQAIFEGLERAYVSRSSTDEILEANDENTHLFIPG
ncbi:hypothetical protein BDR22DRAFT_886956 [Usnea florida]